MATQNSPFILARFRVSQRVIAEVRLVLLLILDLDTTLWILVGCGLGPPDRVLGWLTRPLRGLLIYTATVEMSIRLSLKVPTAFNLKDLHCL